MSSPQRQRLDSGTKFSPTPPLVMPHLTPAMVDGAMDFRPASPPRAGRGPAPSRDSLLQSPPGKPIAAQGSDVRSPIGDSASDSGKVTSGRVSRQQSLRSRNGHDVLASTYSSMLASAVVFHRGFVEKTAKYTKSWVSRYLRLEDREVSYSVTEDSRVKGSLTLKQVERFAEAVRHEQQDARDYYGMVLYGERDEKWVIRCVNEHQFRDWYTKFRTVLWQHGLAAPLNGGLGHYDPRLKLAFASIPLRELGSFAKLEEAVIYGFYHVIFHVPLLTKAPQRCVLVAGDNAVYVCASDGTIMRCLPYHVMTRALWASRREGGSILGIGALRPEPDLVVRFDQSDALKEFLKVLKTVYQFAVKPYLDDDDDIEAPSPELYTSQATYVAMEEFETHPPVGYKLVVLVPTQKKDLAEALQAAAAEAGEADPELVGVSLHSHDDGERSRSVGSRESPGIRSNEASRGNSIDDLTASAKGTPSGSRTFPLGTPPNLTPPAASLAHLGNHVVAMEVRPEDAPMATNAQSADDMHSLLQRLNLLEYEPTLLDAGVDYDVLLVASPSELLRYGVRNPHHRSAIMREVLNTTAYKLAPLVTSRPPPPQSSTAPAKLQIDASSPVFAPQFAPPCDSRLASPHGAKAKQPAKRTSRRFSIVGSPHSGGVYLTPKAVRADQSTDSFLDSLLSPVSQESPHETDHTNSFVGGLSFAAPPDGAPMSLSFAALPPSANAAEPQPDLRNLSTVSADSL